MLASCDRGGFTRVTEVVYSKFKRLLTPPTTPLPQECALSPQQHALQVLGVDGAAAVIILSPQVHKLIQVVRAQLPALQQPPRCSSSSRDMSYSASEHFGKACC